MLLGEYDHQIDEKNRMFLPAKMRGEFGMAVYVVCGLDRCVTLYPEANWIEYAAKLDELPQVRARATKRKLLSSAERMPVDSHGRILIPQRLREYAGLEGKNVKVLGVGKYAEIWDPALLAECESKLNDADMIQDLIDLGF